MIRNQTTELLKDSSLSPFLFVVNPKSGTGRNDIRHLLKGLSPNTGEVVVTQSTTHSNELIHAAIEQKRKAVVAVGGDGTVHTIGAQLVGTNVALGIIPCGSGNGVARHLGIPMNLKTALTTAIKGYTRTIDTFTVNGRPAIGFAGVGFDGYVAKCFDEHRKRGFASYVKLTFKAYVQYKAGRFALNGRQMTKYAIVAANISQFGNNAFINPNAIDDDGLIEVITLDRPKNTEIPRTAMQLFNKKLAKSHLVDISKESAVAIENMDLAELQIDGEPAGAPPLIHLEVKPKSLNVITG